jgi:SAM-dependent methyltransferase
VESINCAVCGLDSTEAFLTGKDIRYMTTEDSFTLVRCRGCGLAYMNPRPTKDEIGKYYPDNYRTHETLEDARKFKERLRRHSKRRTVVLLRNPWYLAPRRGSRVLDIGFGAGEMLQRLKGMGCECFGIDVDGGNVTRVRERLGLDVRACDIERGSDFGPDFFDVVIMRHSLEHIHNPREALREVWRVLKPGGRLLVGVPNIESAVFKLTGSRWGHLEVPRHLFHFSPKTLRLLLERTGFAVQAVRHEIKVSTRSLRRLSSPPLLARLIIKKPSTAGTVLALLRRGEWIMAEATKKEAT